MSQRQDEEARQLAAVRQQIDSIDSELLRLINARAQCAQQVAAIKIAHAEGVPSHFHRPEREAQILAQVQQNNPGPLPNAAVALLFRELMSACLALEKPLRVAYLGPAGTFSEAAAVKHFGQAIEGMAQPTIADIFAQVERGLADYGLVPVENSTEGMVGQTLDLFVDTALTLCGEVELAVQHCLLGRQAHGTPRRVLSHQQSLGQCRNWLNAHLPGVEQQAVSSNSEAARLASEDPQVVAIAGRMAAEHYGLQVLAERIEDFSSNTTRFLVLGQQPPGISGHDKTSLLVSVPNRPGALYRLLAPFEHRGISLTRLESRPAKSHPWRYRFFIDFEGHRLEPDIAALLEEIEQHSAEVKWLGSYQRASNGSDL